MSVAESLVPFGFTALESEIYVFLLRVSPATGYRIAQGINKPAANTYKAIQTLQAKGAILVEESSSRLCRAVPLEELMNRLQKDFESRRKSTEKQLKSVGKPAEDNRIYQLLSRDQILSRAREMLASSKSSVLFKMPADDLLTIEGDVEKAADRSVSVCGITGYPTTIEGAEMVAGSDGETDSITVVGDGDQVLIGTISSEGDSEAIWTRNTNLAKIIHSSLSAEFALAQVNAMLAADEKKGRMVRAIENRPKLD